MNFKKNFKNFRYQPAGMIEEQLVLNNDAFPQYSEYTNVIDVQGSTIFNINISNLRFRV